MVYIFGGGSGYTCPPLEDMDHNPSIIECSYMFKNVPCFLLDIISFLIKSCPYAMLELPFVGALFVYSIYILKYFYIASCFYVVFQLFLSLFSK